MACVTHEKVFAPPSRDAGSEKGGVLAMITHALRRIGRAIADSRERQVERRMVSILERSGGRLTDDVEREMMQELCGPGTGVRAHPGLSPRGPVK